MKDFIAAHLTTISALAIYMFLGLISSLPVPGDPRPVSTKFYETLYNFLHLMSNRIVEKSPKLAPGTIVTTTTPTVLGNATTNIVQGAK
jgi:hypothetical protein